MADLISILIAILVIGVTFYFVSQKFFASTPKTVSKPSPNVVKENSPSSVSSKIETEVPMKKANIEKEIKKEEAPKKNEEKKMEENNNNKKQSEKIVLKEITFYPIKSCRGISLQKATIDRFGIMYDRAWMIVNLDTDTHGRFITQRTHPKLALVETKIENETLIIRTPTQPDLKIPISKLDDPKSKIFEVEVWDSIFNAIDEGDEPAEYFQKFLETDSRLRLVRRMQTHNRKVPPRWSANKHSLVGFADAFPFLLASEESRVQLSNWAGKEFSMKRFRPNFLIEGQSEPFEEDNWKKIRIGSIKFEVSKKCTRCKFTTVDPETGIMSEDQEPLGTLHKYREGLLLGGKEVCFGQNLVHESFGDIEVGQILEVLE